MAEARIWVTKVTTDVVFFQEHEPTEADVRYALKDGNVVLSSKTKSVSDIDKVPETWHNSVPYGQEFQRTVVDILCPPISIDSDSSQCPD